MTISTCDHITEETHQQYKDLGFCVVANLFTNDEIQEIEDFFESYRTVGGKAFEGNTTYEEIDITERQLRAMHPHRYSEKAKAWVLNPNVAEVLGILLGKPPLLAQSMYYYKPPGARGQGMHQDNFYLLSKPTTCIGAWTAIDDADNENGCLWVVPESDKSPIICPDKSVAERWLNYGDSHITKFPREQKPICVPVPRGSTMFFSGNLIHGSGPNRTKDRSRRAFIGHYIDQASEEVSQYYQPILTMQGDVVGSIKKHEGGGPCGDGWLGAVH